MSSTKGFRGKWSEENLCLCPGRINHLYKYTEAQKRKPYAQK